MKILARYFIVLFVTICICACSGVRERAVSGADSIEDTVAYPITVDVREKYPSREIFAQDFLTVKYVPLQTGDEMLVSAIRRLGEPRPFVTEKGVFMLSGNRVVMFDREGRFVSQIGMRGKGPDEYTEVGAICADDEKEELYICDEQVSDILVFGYNGKFKRKLHHSNIRGIGFYGDNSLVTPSSINKSDPPFEVISSVDGKFERSVIPPYSEPVVYVTLKGSTAYYTDRVRTYGNELILKDISTDTITALDCVTGEVYPKYIKLPSNLGRDISLRSYIDYGFETPLYAFLFTIDYDRAARVYAVEKMTGKIFDALPQNRDIKEYYMQPSRFYQGADNTVVYFFDALDLVEMHEQGRLSGELAKIADALDEDSNPVMMIAGFK